MLNPFGRDTMREFVSSLSHNKTRTCLTAFGIFWGAAMLGMLWGGSEGAQGMMRRQFQGFATNMGGISTARTTLPYRGFEKGRTWNFNDVDYEALRHNCPFLEYTTPMLFAQGSFKYDTKTLAGSILGTTTDFFKVQELLQISGRTLNDVDETSARKVAVIGNEVAQSLFGDIRPEGKYIEVMGIPLQVVGVVSQKSEVSIGGRVDKSVLIPESLMRLIYRTDNDIDYIVYTVQRPYTPSDVLPYIYRIGTNNHTVHPNDTGAYNSMDISEMFKTVDRIFLGLTLLALFVGGASLLAGVIGVGNIMWITVRERTCEFGIRKAIGATSMQIALQVIFESTLLTLFSGCMGVCFAVGVLAIANQITYDPLYGYAHFELYWTQALSIVGIFAITGMAAGWMPARKTFAMKPIQALHDN